jgi:hypothetical protein
MQRNTFIPEVQAAEMLGFKPATLRAKVKGIGRYRTYEKMPITFTTGGKGFRYSLEDINRHLAKTSSK